MNQQKQVAPWPISIPLPEFDSSHHPAHGVDIASDISAAEEAQTQLEDAADWAGQGPWGGGHGHGRPAGRTEGRRDGLDTYFERFMATKTMVCIKTIYSLGFCGFCLYILCKGWLDNKTLFFKAVPGWGVGILYCVIAFYLIAILEGLEVCIVQFKALNCDYFKISHPRAYYCMRRIKEGRNVDYFIQGRQVMMTFSVFLSSHFTAFDSSWEDWPSQPHGQMSTGFKTAFLKYSLAGLIITVFIAQIPTQLICSRVPVTMMNLPFNTVLVEVALFIEWIGLTTATKVAAWTWLKVIKDPPVPQGVVSHHGLDHNAHGNKRYHVMVEYLRLILRFGFVCWTLFCLYLICSGFIANQGAFLKNIPGVARGAIYFGVAFYLVSMCEALQIGIVKCYSVDCTWFKTSHHGAWKVMNLCKRGNNLNRFLEGRQLFVTAGAFLAANLSSFGTWDHFQYTHTKYPKGFQTFLIEDSFAGAFVTVLLAQLVPRIVAAGAPIAVMNIWGNYWIVRLCTLIESSGVGATSNFLAKFYLHFLVPLEPPPPIDLYKSSDNIIHDHQYMFSYDSGSVHDPSSSINDASGSLTAAPSLLRSNEDNDLEGDPQAQRDDLTAKTTSTNLSEMTAEQLGDCFALIVERATIKANLTGASLHQQSNEDITETYGTAIGAACRGSEPLVIVGMSAAAAGKALANVVRLQVLNSQMDGKRLMALAMDVVAVEYGLCIAKAVKGFKQQLEQE